MGEKNTYLSNSYALKFFMYNYFGILEKEIEEGERKEIAQKCARRAYLDLNRTLCFNDNLKNRNCEDKLKIESWRKGFCNKICKDIVIEIDNMLNGLCEEIDLDKWYVVQCEKITASAREARNSSGDYILAEIDFNHGELSCNEGRQRFYDGQAQKWLNMTIKYMWLTGLWHNEFSKILPKLHVPVDSFIIEAIWHENESEDEKGNLQEKKEKKEWKIKLPCGENEKNRMNKYSTNYVVPWSRWTKTQYIEFQKTLREFLNGRVPIIWEGDTWINVSEKRKEDKKRRTSVILEQLQGTSD